MSKREKSKYLEYFDMTQKEKATCKIKTCQAVITRSGGSSSGMKYHLEHTHRIFLGNNSDGGAEKPEVVSKPLNTLDNFVQRESKEEMISREAAQFCATFRYLARSLLIKKGMTYCGHTAPRTHSTVQRYVHASAEKHRQNVREKLQRLLSKGQRFCVITDEWTCGSKRRRYQNVKLHIKGNN